LLDELMIFFALAAALSTACLVIPGAVRLRIWLGLPLAAVALAVAGAGLAWLTGDATAGVVLPVVALLLTLLARLLLFRRWSTLAAATMSVLALASLAYVVFAVLLTIGLWQSPPWMVVSTLLLALEGLALFLTLSYAFEILDVLSRRQGGVPQPPVTAPRPPRVAVQVPAYSEPVEVVGETLRSLARLDYPDYLVQVVDNNTPDPALWRPLEALCAELGPRFQFIHLESWPGFKAGALNEATRRLPPDVEVVAVVDADYLVQPDFLSRAVPHFADPSVAFVQLPQSYRDWEDDPYLRGLNHSYRYFFDITMPARAHRNAIIFCGTMGLVRRSCLEAIGGWNESCITEDAEASLRLLGHGWRGVYLAHPAGAGLMPLDFQGLKKQRHRWALGGMQILRRHWRELLPLAPHRLRLTRAQRLNYLLGSVQWFGELLTFGFTVMLLATAVGVALGHRFPIRPLLGPLVLVPLSFLFAGVMRALWALRATSPSCTWGDAARALRIWFSLSWVVMLATVAGLVRDRAEFLRTPKVRGGRRTVLRAILEARAETVIGVAGVIGALLMLRTSLTPAVGVLALMLVFEASVYLSAPWAGAAAEGIRMTPLRELYRRSAQSTGERPVLRAAVFTVPAGAAAALAATLLVGALVTAPTPPAPTPGLPTLGQALRRGPVPIPVPSLRPALPPTAAPTPTALPTALPSAPPTAAPASPAPASPPPSAPASPTTAAAATP
jgi:cellulose synthase/poly-beta-1,6-N-acetylglucosamine synthase-like glycosyltransferase